MRAKAPWGVMVALAAPAPTWALGLGDIELFSALNQPFRADISLSATADELNSLSVTLADRATFERSGLDRPSWMSNFQFAIARDSVGAPVIRVTSAQSVTEPFVTMVVEAAHSSGVLLREYTVFLDPPVLLPAQPAAAPVAPPRTGVNTDTQPATAPITRQSQPAPQARPAAPAPAPAPRSAPAPRGTGQEGNYGPVQRSETLWAIAQRHQPTGVTMNQTMVAIYEANRNAFSGNINLLRVGSILRIPPRSELLARSTANANAEVQRQNDNWRQGIADQGNRVVLTPPSPDSVQPAPVSAGSNQPAANGDVTRLQSEVETLRAELEENRRLLELRNSELSDLQNQLSNLANAPASVVDPAVTPGVTDAPVTAPGVDISPAPGPDAPVFADDGPSAVTPAPTPDPAPVVTPPAPPPIASSPSLVDNILGWLTGSAAWIVGGLGAILLGALWFMRRRSEGDEVDVTGQWDALDAGMDETKTGHKTEPSFDVPTSRDYSENRRVEQTLEADNPFTVEEKPSASSTTLPIDDAEEIAADHFAQASSTDLVSGDDTMSTSAVLNLDEADPVAEADFHMAYGLYDQAAELLTKELSEAPERRDLQLKLLEVYFVWGNKDEFLSAATNLREQMGMTPDSDWDKVLIMGKQICPSAELFAAAAAAGGAVDVSLGDSMASSLDFPFDSGESEDEDLDMLDFGEATGVASAGESESVDLDLTGNHPAPLVELAESTAPMDATGTLNIGADTAAGLEAALFDSDSEGPTNNTEVSADDETVAVPSGMDPELLAETQESPTIPGAESGAHSTMTVESPTIEQVGAEQPTVESPNFGSDDETLLQATAVIGDTAEVPGYRDDGATAEMPALDTSGGDYTAELELNDLGLDMADLDDPLGLDELVEDLEDSDGDTRQQETLGGDELLSATGITEVLREQTESEKTLGTSEQTQLQSGGTLLGKAEVEKRQSADTEMMEKPATAVDDFDLDLDDLSAALSDAETVEQPRSVEGAEFGFSSSDRTPIDLDVGETFVGDDDPTDTEDMRSADPQTLTEVGTKLDLARAYIDMGDPEGARSILEEVLSEGDTTQRNEAQSLIDAIGA